MFDQFSQNFGARISDLDIYIVIMHNNLIHIMYISNKMCGAFVPSTGRHCTRYEGIAKIQRHIMEDFVSVPIRVYDMAKWSR